MSNEPMDQAQAETPPEQQPAEQPAEQPEAEQPQAVPIEDILGEIVRNQTMLRTRGLKPDAVPVYMRGTVLELLKHMVHHIAALEAVQSSMNRRLALAQFGVEFAVPPHVIALGEALQNTTTGLAGSLSAVQSLIEHVEPAESAIPGLHERLEAARAWLQHVEATLDETDGLMHFAATDEDEEEEEEGTPEPAEEPAPAVAPTDAGGQGDAS